jgi:argininosuccinate synthase
MDRIVFAYAGDVDASAAIPWLREHMHAEVVAVTMDLGQGRAIEAMRDRALAVGALRAHVLDLREEFAQEFVLRALQADALYDDRSPMTAALSRPLIARRLVDIAEIEHAHTVAHGGGAGGRRVAMDVLIRALNAKLKILAPAREWGMSHEQVAEYAKRFGIHVSDDDTHRYQVDLNLWGRSIESPTLDDEPPEEMYALTRAARDCPDEPAYVDIAFERGSPAAVNGIAMPLIDLIASLGTIASAHGVGRVELVEHRLGNTRLREVGEAPSAVLLHAAHKELRKMASTREHERFSRIVSAEYADVIYGGLWFSPLRKSLDAYVATVQERITGLVRFKLFKGSFSIVGRQLQTAPSRRATIIPVARS